MSGSTVRRTTLGAIVLATVAAAIVASQTFAGSAASAAGTRAAAPRGFLAQSHIMLRSAKNVNLKNQTVRLPLQRGTYKGEDGLVRQVQGPDAGHRIFYISTESSDPLAATLERATFVPLLSSSARERTFIFANGRHGNGPQAQGIDHLIRDGHASENASLQNRGLIDALRNGGDLLNTIGDFPSLGDPRHANAYSPLWDAQLDEVEESDR